MDASASGGDILIEGRTIRAVGKISEADKAGALPFDAKGLTAIPGFVQTHIHLCQTMFRNTADDLELLDWLSKHIWPGEASLDAETLKLTAKIGIGELLLGGTTTILDMATLRHTDAVFAALSESGLRAISGKCLMDDPETCPPVLLEPTEDALRETEEIIEKWHGHDEGRLQVAVTPRFAVSCTTPLLKKSIELARKKGLLIHTHASENRGEIDLVRRRTGFGNLEYFENIGLLGPDACLAHCVHLDEADKKRLEKTKSNVLHCPGSNLKLASGIAPVPELIERGISVSLGADGAPCNNNLDAFTEMRLAALIQKPGNGPRAMPAEPVFRMATASGAKALGKEKETGRLIPGMKADITLVDLHGAHSVPSDRVMSALVYAAHASDVRHVFVDGELLVKDSRLTRWNLPELIGEFEARARHLMEKSR